MCVQEDMLRETSVSFILLCIPQLWRETVRRDICVHKCGLGRLRKEFAQFGHSQSTLVDDLQGLTLRGETGANSWIKCQSVSSKFQPACRSGPVVPPAPANQIAP
jgi:hypothetical protein